MFSADAFSGKIIYLGDEKPHERDVEYCGYFDKLI